MKKEKRQDNIVKLENYKFSGVDASLVGSIKSVADYYDIPLTTTWIYGMTGVAFLHIVDEKSIEPNGGPTEPDVFNLVRNLGIEINGLHVYAHGEMFRNLLAEAWEKARLAINSKQPVFAKNLDIENQTSVIYAYDDHGYYTHSWHTGYDHSEDVIPWTSLGLSRCPCINCVNSRKLARSSDKDEGLISLHWANKVPATDELSTFKEALNFVIQLNEQEEYNMFGKKYLVGNRAYEEWITALENNEMNKYFFSLFVEILNESRSHAIQFLIEIKRKFHDLNPEFMDEAIDTYRKISVKYKILRDMYPYQEPPEKEVKQREKCLEIVKELMVLERIALEKIKEIYSRIP